MTESKADRQSEKMKREKEKIKEEVAAELGLKDDISKRGWSNLTSRETGKIGGHVAQRLRRRKRT